MAGSGNNTRNPQNANDNYPAAALRHFHDAEILRDADAYENALCHYAFSVECAQKALLYWKYQLRPSAHGIDKDWTQVSSLLNAWDAIDSGLASAMPIGIMPPKLYKDHPSRRYQRCFDVTEQEMADCQAFAQSMEQVIMNMLMDGLITI